MVREGPYPHRNYAVAEQLLLLRSKAKLTQAELAARAGVHRRSLQKWESGETYPTAVSLRDLIAALLALGVFAPGREQAEATELWQMVSRAAPQHLPPFDPGWFDQLQGKLIDNAPAPAAGGPRVDWGEALAISAFYGREWELGVLAEWVVEERCRVVTVLGLGGIGKSALAVTLMHRMAPHFDVVIWRSLRNLPACEVLLDDLLWVLAAPAVGARPESFDARLNLLLNQLRSRRILLVLDNLESLLGEGEETGRIRAGYEGFGQFLRRAAETDHASCVLLTSREKPGELVSQEGSHSPVRNLRVGWLEADACAELLAEKGATGPAVERAKLIETYAGNPLALKIVAQTIIDLFDGEIGLFLEQGEVIYGGIRELLSEQFARLSALERRVLLWLAILREPATFDELIAVHAMPVARSQLLEGIEALRRRSLVEPSAPWAHKQGTFTLQSVVLEYATARLIGEMSSEIRKGRLQRMIAHSLELAPAREDVRQTQQRLLVAPVLEHLRSAYPQQSALEEHLCALLAELREWSADLQGYGPANLLALLRELRGHLRGLDLSQLSLRGAYLQGVEMQDTTLARATVRDCVWTATFGAIWSVAISPDGRYWAAGSRRGEMWVWEQQRLRLVWSAHADVVRSLSFSPDSRHLASGSYDGTVKVWDVQSGALLWQGAHSSNVSGVAYAPAGDLLASAGTEGAVRLWDAQTGTVLETLPQPHPVFAVAWGPAGHLLASLGAGRQVRLWQIQPGGPTTGSAIPEGHAGWGMGLAFAPDGRRLASASWDQTIKLWDVVRGGVLATLVGHSDRAQTVAWSPDGRTVASSGFDETIRLWDVESNSLRTVLAGFAGVVFSVAFTPDSGKLLSGSTDGTLRLWDAESGQCEQILRGYADSLYDIAWSPDGARLASGSSNGALAVWEAQGQTPPRLLQGHRYLVFGVAWSPDGRWLASSGWDNAIQIWDALTETSAQVIRQPDDPHTSFYGIAWSPDGRRLACGNYRREVQVWEVASGTRRWIARDQPASARRVTWSPDGALLASAGDDGSVYVWDAADGSLLKQLPGHQGKVNEVAWSPDGQRLASAGGGSAGGEVFVWDGQSEQRVQVLPGHPGIVYAVAWNPAGERLVSGGSDGRLRWWDVRSGECLWARRAHQGTVQALKVSPDGTRLASCGDDGAVMIWDLRSGAHLQTMRRDRPYERLNITGIKGLSEAQLATLGVLGAIDDGAAPNVHSSAVS